MSWAGVLLVYICIGPPISAARIALQKIEGLYSGFSAFEFTTYSLIWPLTLLEVADLFWRAISKPRIVPLSRRADQIDKYLDRLLLDREIDAHQLELIRSSYRWLLGSGSWATNEHGTLSLDKHQYAFNLCTLDLLDNLVVSSEGSLIDANIAEFFSQGYESHTKDSEVIVSPFFEDTFLHVDSSQRMALVRELKEIARTTGDWVSVTHAQDEALRRIKMNGPLPCILLSGNAALVIEAAPIGIYFLGILTGRPQ